jgi:hypothetical protein
LSSARSNNGASIDPEVTVVVVVAVVEELLGGRVGQLGLFLFDCGGPETTADTKQAAVPVSTHASPLVQRPLEQRSFY